MKWLMEACSKLRKLSSVETRIVLSELYEERYGIYSRHSSTEYRPLSSVALHPSEDFTNDSILEESMTLFVRKKIHELFGISHLELLRQSREVVGLYFKVADKEMQKRSEIADGVQAEIRRDAEKQTSTAAIANAKKKL